jgi:hypothetical protein
VEAVPNGNRTSNCPTREDVQRSNRNACRERVGEHKFAANTEECSAEPHPGGNQHTCNHHDYAEHSFTVLNLAGRSVSGFAPTAEDF